MPGKRTDVVVIGSGVIGASVALELARRGWQVTVVDKAGGAGHGSTSASSAVVYAGLDLHQLRHSAATHLGEAEVPLQLIMGKTRHKNPRTAMRYVQPGAEAIAKVTEVLAPSRRTH
ncbi:FAD-dependent oxidoreductase [Streptosporangium sp. NPDC003464]